MRISDWSSDVCSSDLRTRPRRRLDHHRAEREPGDDAVARREMAGERFTARRLFGDQQLVDRDPFLQRGIFGGEGDVDPAGDHRRGRAAERADMRRRIDRSEEHTSELQSLMRISYAVFCLKKKKLTQTHK